MSRLLFSVIIPTYNRADEIGELLDSLDRQTFSRDCFEVLIVDDGSTDNTDTIVRNHQSGCDYRIRCFRRNHAGPGPARNYGMSQAAGEYLLFIDSDCEADPDWLKALAAAIQQEKPEAFGGPDAVRSNFTPLQKAIDYSMTSFITTGGMRGHTSRKLAKFYPRSFNMGIHRDIYAQLGGMGTLRHGQDLEFSRRIVASGAKVIFIPDAIVYHKRRSSLPKFFRQMFNWGVARINLAKMDRAILEPLHFIPALGSIGYLLLCILALFTPLFAKIWSVATLLAILLLLYILGDAFRKYRETPTALLTPLVALCQVFAYGFGFSVNFIRRMIFKRGEYTGFVRKYYK